MVLRHAQQAGRLAQLVRAPALQAGGRVFESRTAHHLFNNFRLYNGSQVNYRSTLEVNTVKIQRGQEAPDAES